ncbi:hypothetical protein D5266_01025 [bacterium c-19]|nr:hypothetical protein [bacterium c-19]
MRKEFYEQILLIHENPDKMIYLVRHKISQKLYIMKYLASSLDLSMYTQLMEHPHQRMANVIECDHDERYSYVVEEYVNGTTLEYEISTNQLSYSDKITIMMELFDVLIHLHNLEPPIIHRDIKPANIMLEDGHVKLIDFEIARNVVPDKCKDTQIMGSIGYAPPEQFGFAQSDQRSDIYALGMIIKELFTEKKAQIAYRFLLEKCLQLDPKKRFTNVRELRKEFIRGTKGRKARKMTWRHRLQSYEIIGLRQDPIWVKVLTALYVAFALLFASCTDFESTDARLSVLVLRICIFVIVMFFVWIPTNSFHLLEMTPLYRSSSKIVRIINGCFIWFAGSCILLFATALAASIFNLPL